MVGFVTGVQQMLTAALLSRLSLEGYRGAPPRSQGGGVRNINKSCDIVAVTSERSSKAEWSSGCPPDSDSKNNSNNFLLQKFIRFPSAERLIPPRPAPAWPPPAAPQPSSHPSILSPEEFTAVRIFCPSGWEQLECRSPSVHINIRVCLCPSIRVWVLITHSCFC